MKKAYRFCSSVLFVLGLCYFGACSNTQSQESGSATFRFDARALATRAVTEEAYTVRAEVLYTIDGKTNTQSEDFTVSAQYDSIISWADLYDSTSMEAKKMIFSYLINRIEVSRGYKVKIDFNIDLAQFRPGKAPVSATG